MPLLHSLLVVLYNEACFRWTTSRCLTDGRSTSNGWWSESIDRTLPILIASAASLGAITLVTRVMTETVDALAGAVLKLLRL